MHQIDPDSTVSSLIINFCKPFKTLFVKALNSGCELHILIGTSTFESFFPSSQLERIAILGSIQLRKLFSEHFFPMKHRIVAIG